MKSFYEWVKLLENQKKTIHASHLLELSNKIEHLIDDLAESEEEKKYFANEDPKSYHDFPSQEELQRGIDISRKQVDNELTKWKRMFGEDYPSTGDFEVVGDDHLQPSWRDTQMQIKSGAFRERRFGRAMLPTNKVRNGDVPQKPFHPSDLDWPEFDPNML